MRISDWSSDVCSSDLLAVVREHRAGANANDRARTERKMIARQDTERGAIVALIDIDAGTTDIFDRSEEHTSELQSLMRISYAVFCLKKKKQNKRDRALQNLQQKTITKNHRLKQYKSTNR